MKLSVPFIPDEKYTDFLKNHIKDIASVYFSLHQDPVLDSRTKFFQATIPEIAGRLKTLGSVKKYVLLNSRFISPDLYVDSDFLNQTLDSLEILKTNAGLCGIVFSDAYLLNALASTQREVTRELEAVPGINCMLDTGTKTVSFLSFIESSGFKMPAKLIADRSLNRDLTALKNMARTIRQRYPQISIELLANEGCIAHCPFKPAHDAQIAYENTGVRTGTGMFRINQTIGCQPYFHDFPHKFLKSPFIRPEDTRYYADTADTIKICGRTLGVNFLTTCIRAYIKNSFQGNLLDLMDATRWMADIINIDNKKLEPDFFKQVTSCTKDCKHCNICGNFFSKAAKQKPFGFRYYKDYL